MLGLGWLTFKQAQEALRTGRLDEAYDLLRQPQIQGHKRCWDLLDQLMRAYVERGEKHLRQDDAASAWSDLLKAEQIGITDNAPLRLRQELTRLGLAEVRALLDAGEPGRAAEAIVGLRQKAVRHPEMDSLEEGARDWVAARDCMDRGEFAQALETLERAGRLLPVHRTAIERFRNKVEERNREFAPKLVDLHKAAQHQRWQEVLRLSEELLAQAPQHKQVRQLRGRAWKAIEPTTIGHVPPAAAIKSAPEVKDDKLRRFILWIDGVGGFLVCLENRVTLGQGGPECMCDIPVMADISRMHASLERDSEGYVLKAMRPATVNNMATEEKLLQSGDRLTLGRSCQLVFKQEVPISTSARLDLVSGHRFGQAVDGVLLMAETLLLGPGSQVHVSMPIKKPVILYRNKEEIGIRSPERIWIDGQVVEERGILAPGCTVSGSDFSMAMEPLGRSQGKG